MQDPPNLVVSVINPFSSFQKVYKVKMFQRLQNVGGKCTFLHIFEDRRCDTIIYMITGCARADHFETSY